MGVVTDSVGGSDELRELRDELERVFQAMNPEHTQLSDFVDAARPVVVRRVADAKADQLDQIIDRYFRGEANRFSLNKNVLDWIRAQPEYLMRYPREALAVGQEGENDE